MTTVLHDPDQIRIDYQARKRRQRRLQLTPPMSYWNRYRAEEIAREEEHLKRMEDAMDTIGIIAGIIAAIGFITVLAVNEKIYWLPVIIAVVTVVWWLGWGRHKYE